MSVELWKWCLAAAVGLLFIEAWLTGRVGGSRVNER